MTLLFGDHNHKDESFRARVKDAATKIARKVHFLSRQLFESLVHNEIWTIMITGTLIILPWVLGSMRPLLAWLRSIDMSSSDMVKNFVEASLPLFDAAVPILKDVSVVFVILYITVRVSRYFIDPTRNWFIFIDKNSIATNTVMKDGLLDKKWRPVDHDNFSPDLDAVVDLIYEFYCEVRLAKKDFREMLESWWKTNNDIIGLLTGQNDEIIGCVLLLPLDEEIGSLNFRGLLRTSDIPLKAIARSGRGRYVRIQAICLKAEYQNIEYSATIFRAALKILHKIAAAKPIIFAEPLTPHAIMLLRSFGFEKVEMADPKRTVMAINLRDTVSLNYRAKRMLELYREVNKS